MNKTVTINILDFDYLNTDNTMQHMTFHLHEDNISILLTYDIEIHFMELLTTLEFLNQDAEARQLYEERQRALQDEILAIEGTEEEDKRKTSKRKKRMGQGVCLKLTNRRFKLTKHYKTA